MTRRRQVRSPAIPALAAIASVAALVAFAGCASPSAIPPAETPFAVAKLAESADLPPLGPATPPPPAPPQPSPGAPHAALDPVAGIVVLDDPRIAAFVAKLQDAAAADAALAATPLDADLVLAAVWTRNPAVAAARAGADAARRVYEQASWLEDVESRFRSLGAPATNVRQMMESAPLSYPGAAALRGEMLDREVEMALARLRMRFLESGVDAVGAYHVALHHTEELKIRMEQVAVLERVVEAAKARVESGRAPQAELLESHADLAMVRNDQVHAETALVAARRRLNSLLDRADDAPLVLAPHDDPPETTPDAPVLLALARRSSPEVAMARADAARLGAAERMAYRMVNATRGPGAVAGGDGGEASMGAGPGAMAGGPTSPDLAAPAWAAEIAARRVAAEHAADEAVRVVERTVADATYQLASMARMFRLALRSTEPATRQALDERMRLYESGRGELGALLGAFRRHLDALHDVAQARHDYGSMEAMLWMAVGARPELSNGGAK